MSVESEINRISANVSDTLSAISEMGGTVSEGATSDDMAAGVRSIPVGATIDDTTPSTSTTYSSSKIDTELNSLNEANAQQDTEIAKKANDSDLAVVAKSGSYNDLSGKPEIPAAYTLPTASATQLGGVMPVAKTDEMTQAVGVDAEGKLFTAAGSGGGETLTVEDTLLAECVIPSGTAQWEKTQTGLTVGNLREYKIFGVILETSSSFLSGMHLGSSRIYYNYGSKLRLLFEWLDSDKRAVYLTNGASGNGYNNRPFVSTSAIQDQSVTMGAAGLQIIKSDVLDDAAVTVYNHEALTADAKVKIYGVIKG